MTQTVGAVVDCVAQVRAVTTNSHVKTAGAFVRVMCVTTKTIAATTVTNASAVSLLWLLFHLFVS